MDDSTLAKIEKQRTELEENVAKLRKSLRHWQTLEIDYEGLKEEFQLLPKDASPEKCLQAAKDSKPVLVDEDELRSLLEDKQRGYRRPLQLVDLLTKRVEYVIRNVSTVRKQLSDAEKKRNALLLAQDPEQQDYAGLPLSEITEELDDEGQVVSSKIETPGSRAPDLLDVLRRAGVPDIEDSKANKEQAPQSNSETDGSDVAGEGRPAVRTSIENGEVSVRKDQDVALQQAELEPTNPDDTEEDAALRQAMLQYGLDEVGAIVAELDLEDSGDPYYDEGEDEDDYLSDYDEDEDLYDDESEDEKGATKNPVIAERYRRHMEALSKKHGITDLRNLGPEPELPKHVKDNLDRPPPAEAARNAAIAREEATKSVLKPSKTNDHDEPQRKKKKVAFAPSLDVAKEESALAPSTSSEPAIHPVGDHVIERDVSTNPENGTHPPPSSAPSLPHKISRFKATRSSAPQTPMFPPPMDFPTPTPETSTPSGPAGRTISTTLVERPASKTTAPIDPNDFNEELHRKEVAVEYQKMRNRKIHEQGGYVKGGQEDNFGEELAPEAIVDETTGKPRKISRFKAARLNAGS